MKHENHIDINYYNSKIYPSNKYLQSIKNNKILRKLRASNFVHNYYFN